MYSICIYVYLFIVLYCNTLYIYIFDVPSPAWQQRQAPLLFSQEEAPLERKIPNLKHNPRPP